MGGNEGQPRGPATLRRLHDLMCRVNAGEDLASVLQQTVDGVADVTGFAVAAVSYLHPDQHFEVVAVSGDRVARDTLVGRRTPMSEIEGEFALAEDWGLLRFIPHERLGEGPARGWVPDVEPLDVPDAWHPEDALLAPLSSPTGEMVGLLSVDLPRDGRRPDRTAREALEMYAVQAGIAISNAKQRERLREEVRLAAVAREIAQGAGGALDLTAVVEGAVDPLVRGLRCDMLWVRAFEGRGGLVGGSRAASYPPAESETPPSVVEAARELAEAAWRAGRPAPLPPAADVDGTERSVGSGGHREGAATAVVARFVAAAGATVALLVPVGAGPRCLGYFVLGRVGAATPWTPEESAAALEIGRELGRAVLHARLYEREHELVTELRQLDSYKTEMISTLAHELKNPLTAIIGHVEMLEPTGAAISDRSLQAIDRAARRLAHLVEDLLLLSKVEDPHRPLHRLPVDLSESVAETAGLLQPTAAQNGVRVVVEDPTGKVVAHGDPTELDRLVSNLLSNAVKFSPSGGTVTCTLTALGDAVLLRFADEGVGISAADQERLFDEFFRSEDPSVQRVPGTGLGLAIVKRIVDRHGGSIEVTSSLREGTTVTVRLPVDPRASWSPA